MDRQHLAAHLLQTLALAQIEGERHDLDSLTAHLGVRRSDVRSTLSTLHRSGMIDVLRMRLTLRGFAAGRLLANQQLPPLRRAAHLRLVVAA